MAFPDGYTQWGGTAADFTTSRYDLRDGITLIRSRANQVTIWDGPDDDAVQITDLYDHKMAPVTELVSAASGLLRDFWAPSTYEALWAVVQDGEPVRLVPHAGPPVPWSEVGDKPAAFPPSPHAHTASDVTNLPAAVATQVTTRGTAPRVALDTAFAARGSSSTETRRALAPLIAAIRGYNDATRPVLRHIGLGSSVGVGATLTNPSQDAPSAYLHRKLAEVINRTGADFQFTNGSVNGHTIFQSASDTNDYAAAKVTAGNPTTVPLVSCVYGMNDAPPANYHAGQTLPGVRTAGAKLADLVKADSGVMIAFTSPHFHIERLAALGWAMPAGVPSAYPSAVQIPDASRAQSTVMVAAPDGTMVEADYRMLRANEQIRSLADHGVIVIDVEPYWLAAVAKYGNDALFNAGQYNHPNDLGHELSYHAAVDDFIAGLKLGTVIAPQGGYQAGRLGVNTLVPTAAVHARGRLTGDVPLRASSAAGADVLTAAEDGTLTASGPVVGKNATLGYGTSGYGAAPLPATGQSQILSYLAGNQQIATPHLIAVPANGMGLLIVQGYQSGIGRQVIAGLVSSDGATATFVLLNQVKPGGTVITVDTSGASLRVTVAGNNTDLRVTFLRM